VSFTNARGGFIQVYFFGFVVHFGPEGDGFAVSLWNLDGFNDVVPSAVFQVGVVSTNVFMGSLVVAFREYSDARPGPVEDLKVSDVKQCGARSVSG